MKDVQFHEAANIFPLMTGDDFDQLVEDIRANGLRETIKTLDGLIIDGRNRYRACLQASVERRFESVKPSDPVAYVLSLNLHRRHLDESQRGMIGAKALKYYEDEALKRKSEGGKSAGRGRPQKDVVSGSQPIAAGKSRDHAGAAVGVSGPTIGRAKRVIENGVLELAQAVEEGKIKVSTAAAISTLPDAEQRKAIIGGPESIKAAVAKAAPNASDTHTEPEQAAKDTSKSKAIWLANEAVDALNRIPRSDPLRKRGFQIVTDWIKRNK